MSHISMNKAGNSTLIGAFVPVGSRDESDEIKGISHFVEHMLFKGTKTRDKNELKRTIEQYGAVFNAWTSEEHTFYYIQIANQYKEVARDVINDMIHNPIFPENEIKNERSVILQELQMYEDNPQSYVFNLAQRSIFPSQSSLHLPIIGTKETLANIDRNKLIDYHTKMYKNPIMLEVGNIDTVESQFLLPKKFSAEIVNPDKQDVIHKRLGVNQANMILTGLLHFSDPIRAYCDCDFFSGVMNGFTGRLFDVIREKHGLVYSVHFYYQIFSCGTVQYQVYAALDSNKMQEAKNLIIHELNRPVTTEEALFVKNKLLGEYNLNSDSKRFMGQLIINSTVNHMNYNAVIKNYEKHLETSVKNVNNFIANAHFEQAKLVAVVPEK